MYKLLLLFYITAGVIILGTATSALVTSKGGRWPMYFGHTFALGMLIVFLTARPMAFLKPNLAQEKSTIS